MRKLRLRDLPDNTEGHVLKGLIAGEYICAGTLGYKKPGQRTHSFDGPDGRDYHVHDDAEVFIIVQGKAVMQCDGKEYPLTVGDVFIAEAGEDHHLVSDEADPCINLWLHAGPERAEEQARGKR
jgi:mannose-6-phosphate isomerase-like protein (cupin superfamily)